MTKGQQVISQLGNSRPEVVAPKASLAQCSEVKDK